MIEVIFLLVLAAAWLAFATFSDVKTTEIFNWLNFSLIIFALGFRFFYSLFSSQGFGFFFQGLMGLGIFFVVGNFLYYSKVFAGGDEKLMIAMGTVLPFSTNFSVNVKIFVTFMLLFLLLGSVYGFLMSGYFAARNREKFRKEFKEQNRKVLKFSIPVWIFSLGIIVTGLLMNIFVFYLGLLILILPWLYVFSKSVDEACMIKKVEPEKLMEGDWLYKDVKAGSKDIKANWDGLTKKDIGILKEKSLSVLIRRGIAFTPVFLFSFLALIYVYFINTGIFLGLWNSFW